MSTYIAVLDYDHLENPIFLTSFARALAKHPERRGIIIHGDSAYTERLLQNGTPRAEAQRRCMLELNHKLVGLLADQNVSAIGTHPFRKNMIVKKGDELLFNQAVFDQLPQTPMLVLSGLISTDEGEAPVSLPQLVEFLHQSINQSRILIFSRSEQSEMIKSAETAETIILGSTYSEKVNSLVPIEFKKFPIPFELINSMEFGNWPDHKSILNFVC
ncbi:MAG: hypothetical protein AAFW89_09835 [Bacteroidota bacterium]